MTKRSRLSITLLAILSILILRGCSTYRYGHPITGGSMRESVDPNIVRVIEEFRTDVPKLMKKAKIPGCAIVLVDEQGIIWQQGFGVTDLKRKIPVTPGTPFYLASISKTFTATAILLAVQDGLLDLDEPITTYLPDFKVYSRYETLPEHKITLRYLLSHCAGIPHETAGCNMAEADHSFEDRVTSLYGTWLKYPVGEGFSYSGAGYDLAAYVLQRVSEVPFERYLAERVFRPLGMLNSSADHRRIDDGSNHAKGHTIGIKENPTAHGLLGAGGIWMSAADLARFTRLLMNKGTLEGQRYLDESLIEVMLTPHANFNTPQDELQWLYGLGIMYGKLSLGRGDVHIYNHGGGGFGFCTHFEWYPEYGIGAVVLTNRVPQSVRYDLVIGRRLHERGVLEERYPAPAWDNTPCIPKWTGWPKHSPSPYQSEWKKYCGKYRLRLSGYTFNRWARLTWALDLDQGTPRIEVYEKKGYLYVTESKLMKSLTHDWQVKQKLAEVEPGLFFTASGSALDLRGKIPTWRNYRLIRQ